MFIPHVGSWLETTTEILFGIEFLFVGAFLIYHLVGTLFFYPGRCGIREGCSGHLDMYGKLPYIKSTRVNMATATARAERLDARVTREEKEMIETAASLRGTSASDFVRMATREVALRTIREHEVLRLDGEAKRVFVEALLNPPKPNERALAAVQRWKEMTGQIARSGDSRTEGAATRRPNARRSGKEETA